MRLPGGTWKWRLEWCLIVRFVPPFQGVTWAQAIGQFEPPTVNIHLVMQKN